MGEQQQGTAAGDVGGRLLGLGSTATGEPRHLGERKLGNLNNTFELFELERQHFVEVGNGLCKCVPCLWVKKQDVLVQVYKEDAVSSHMGTKTR